MVDLTGKAFVVTGGNGGIGLAMAEGIVLAGGDVAIWARNEEKNAAALAQLESLSARDGAGSKAVAYVCDVADEQSVIAAMRQSVADLGRCDGLFANAGRSGTGTPFVDLPLSEWRAVMDVNLDGVFLCLREAAKYLVEQQQGGSLVAVSSTAAIHGAAGNEAYSASKTALNGLV
ncbi:MAG: SDR family oxidoreductase, partial [Gammaproteobacteria bacterium]|nr:SDR family oxidoreductase [Gammaproteobacteria bacterium]